MGTEIMVRIGLVLLALGLLSSCEDDPETPAKDSYPEIRPARLAALKDQMAIVKEQFHIFGLAYHVAQQELSESVQPANIPECVSVDVNKAEGGWPRSVFYDWKGSNCRSYDGQVRSGKLRMRYTKPYSPEPSQSNPDTFQVYFEDYLVDGMTLSGSVFFIEDQLNADSFFVSFQDLELAKENGERFFYTSEGTQIFVAEGGRSLARWEDDVYTMDVTASGVYANSENIYSTSGSNNPLKYSYDCQQCFIGGGQFTTSLSYETIHRVKGEEEFQQVLAVERLTTKYQPECNGKVELLLETSIENRANGDRIDSWENGPVIRKCF